MNSGTYGYIRKREGSYCQGQQHAKVVAQIHLKKVAKLECNLQEEKVRNENLNYSLGRASETSIRLE
jgi:hypothetical protein